MTLLFPEIQVYTSQVEIVSRFQQGCAFFSIFPYSSSKTRIIHSLNRIFSFVTVSFFMLSNMFLIISSCIRVKCNVIRYCISQSKTTDEKEKRRIRNYLWHNMGRLGSMECRSSKRRGMWPSHTKLNRGFIFRVDSLDQDGLYLHFLVND